MTPEEYAYQQAVISAGTVTVIEKWLKFFTNPALTIAEWLRLLELIFPEVATRRQQAAELGRLFFDSQRAQHHPALPLHEVPLEQYRFEWFVEAMEPSRRRMSQEDAPDHAVGDVLRRIVKEVENGGRRQIIHAVTTDPAPIVKGWARVATGRETCGWCLMLISRGPVFMAAETAGLDLDDQSAKRMIAAGEDVSDYMTQWHTGCDCKVVPVYSRTNWPGKKAAEAALELWGDATKEARKLIDSGKARTDNLNREAINALRRRLERGEITMSDFAFAA
ncbi:VG15 protein [Nocardia sp. IFM 10818]